MIDPVTLATLLCARFSHDLSSLIGSLTGVLELAEQSPDRAAEEISVAFHTARDLSERLQFLRAAWGGLAEPIGAPALTALMRGGVTGRKVAVDTSGLANQVSFPPGATRVILNMVLLAVEAMPRGGVVTISGSPSDDVAVRISGPGAGWPSVLARCLSEEAYAWSLLDDPRTLQAPLTVLIARAAGVRVSMMFGPLEQSTAPPLRLSIPPDNNHSTF